MTSIVQRPLGRHERYLVCRYWAQVVEGLGRLEFEGRSPDAGRLFLLQNAIAALVNAMLEYRDVQAIQPDTEVRITSAIRGLYLSVEEARQAVSERDSRRVASAYRNALARLFVWREAVFSILGNLKDETEMRLERRV